MSAPNSIKATRHWLPRRGLEPVSLSGSPISLDDPNSWMSYEDALMAYEQAKDRFDGIGYVVMEDEGPTERSDASSPDEVDIEKAGIIGISLDRCRSPTTGEVSRWAESLLRRLNSPSCINLLGHWFQHILPGCAARWSEGYLFLRYR